MTKFNLKTMTRWLLCPLLTFTSEAFAGYTNYNSVLIGEEAAGMGGAYTALSGDPAGGAYYNPAGLARMYGNTLSASVNLYNKYDIKFGDQGEFGQAPLRVNRGSIVPIPAASGTVYTFGNFAFGLNIVFPDFNQYTGEITSRTDSVSYLNLRDESLWVGGSIAMNTSEKDSIGLTMYYTSRTYTRSTTDQTTSGGVSTVSTAEKSFSQNSLVYILGYQRQLAGGFSVGASWRLPSLPVAGRGTYFASEISSGGGAITPTTLTSLKAETKIPSRISLGLAYDPGARWKAALDLHWMGHEEYNDLNSPEAADRVRHENVLNASFGGEYYLKDWLAWRVGLFSNFSSQPDISDNPQERTGDQLDMWGFSTNFAVFTTKSSSVTLGGYYSGGKGYSVQSINQSLTKVAKSEQIFSFLVGTAFYF